LPTLYFLGKTILSTSLTPSWEGNIIPLLGNRKLAFIRIERRCLLCSSAYLMKHPPIQMSDEESRLKLEEWLEEMV